MPEAIRPADKLEQEQASKILSPGVSSINNRFFFEGLGGLGSLK